METLDFIPWYSLTSQSPIIQVEVDPTFTAPLWRLHSIFKLARTKASLHTLIPLDLIFTTLVRWAQEPLTIISRAPSQSSMKYVLQWNHELQAIWEATTSKSSKPMMLVWSTTSAARSNNWFDALKYSQSHSKCNPKQVYVSERTKKGSNKLGKLLQVPRATSNGQGPIYIDTPIETCRYRVKLMRIYRRRQSTL